MSLQQPIQRDKIDSRAVYGLKQRRLTATSFSAGLKSPTTPEAGLGLLLEHADVATTSNVTLSGLQNLDGETGAAGDLQARFHDRNALQCGYCTPGMVMSAAALLRDNPKPSEAEIRQYLEGNLCRCTGYHNIIRAILAASGQEVAPMEVE